MQGLAGIMGLAKATERTLVITVRQSHRTVMGRREM